jgi:hypothetical protein
VIAVDETVIAHRTFRDRRPECSLFYLVRIGDLGRGDLVQVDRAACHHLALLTPDFLPRLGLSRQAKVLDLKSQVPRMRSEGAGRP